MTSPGLGGLQPPPMNAPAAGSLIVGVQPGVTPGIVIATKVIIVGASGELLVYNPSAAAGKLVASIAGVAGTDSYLDAVLAGIASYATGSPPLFAVQLNGGAVQFSTASSEAGPWTGLASLGAVVMGGSSGALEASPAVYFLGQGVAATAISGGTVVWSDTNDNLEVLLPSTYTAPVSTGQGNVSAVTVTAASVTELTNAWPIPAADMKAGTKYRIRASGFGTWGSTVQNLSMGVGFGGTQIRSAGISSAILAASQKFTWNAEYTMTCLTTGVSGTVWLSCLFTITATGITYTLATAQLTVSFGSNTTATGETLNTTASTDMELFATWGSTTGAPTITCVESSFERIAT